ncbi:unnamed protein product [Symbiodinium sp. CCMP2592]|nr:unnamed protein product [Symbiodinium sp. CCMP2592]
MPFYQMHPTRALEMLMPVVAIQLLLNEATASTVSLTNQAPGLLLKRLQEILTNIVLLCRTQEWYATHHLMCNYCREFSSTQVLLIEEARAALVERFDEDYEIQQQGFMIIRQIGIGHVLLYRELNYVFNTTLYLAFTARETVHDFNHDLRSIMWYFFQQLSTEHGTIWQETTSELFAQFHSDDLRLEGARNLWNQELADAREEHWQRRPCAGGRIVDLLPSRFLISVRC